MHRRLISVIGFGGVLLACAGWASAATLTWDRNAEDDMKDYQVYACFTPGCTVAKTPAMLQATIAQPAAGVKASSVIDLTGKSGTAAISARDLSLNESGLSVSVPFDKQAPSIPATPTLQ